MVEYYFSFTQLTRIDEIFCNQLELNLFINDFLNELAKHI